MQNFLDLWETWIPKVHSKGANVKYEHRLIWCTMQYIEEPYFYANDVRNLIKQIYGDSVHTFTIAWYLKSLEEMGYVERKQGFNDSSQFKYKTTNKFKQHIQKQMQKEDVV